jgi:hypothetical protein
MRFVTSTLLWLVSIPLPIILLIALSFIRADP